MHDYKRILKKIVPEIFQDTPVLFAYMYGSYSKGEPHSFSDLDIGICVEDLDLRDCLKLELSIALSIDEMMDSSIQSEVRVLNHLPLVVKGMVLTEGILLYSRDETKRIEYETTIRMAYFDFLPVIQQYRKVYRQRQPGSN
jgi:predicted nucleotidyltransferase